MNKFKPGPESSATFTPFPRNYSSALHKKFAKLERQFEAGDLENKPVKATRMLKTAKSTMARIKKA
jgi:hypothetical protein